MAPGVGVAPEHGFLMNLSWLLVTVDRVGLNNLETAEMSGRRIRMIKRAGYHDCKGKNDE